MKFLVQKIDNKLTLDFCHELMVSQIYAKWRGENFTIKYVNDGKVPENIKRPQQYIPIGTVEFVRGYIERYFPNKKECLKPLNVPECLRVYAGRYVWNIVDPYSDKDDYATVKSLFSDNFKEGDKLYRKSLYKIKDENNGLIIFDPNKLEEIAGYQVSKEMSPKILSEWRVFVYHDDIQQVCYYDGDPIVFPDAYRIRNMVDEYSKNNAPIAYTLDICVTEYGTYVMECHRFFSCGLYGFSDYRKLPYMFSQAWFEMMSLD